MPLDYRVISIGTLSKNRFWNETQIKRLAHSTTTLLRDADTTILVDPGLPPEILAKRLDERSGLTPEQIDVVFLTNFRPVHRRSLALFEKADWLMNEAEVDAFRDHLADMTERTRDEPEEVTRLIEEEKKLLARIKPADEKLTPNVHLFPCLGVTPGCAGLLLAIPGWTVIVAGDAVVTREYFEAGRVFEQVADLTGAQEAFASILEVADEIIPGHDNVFHVFGR